MWGLKGEEAWREGEGMREKRIEMPTHTRREE